MVSSRRFPSPSRGVKLLPGWRTAAGISMLLALVLAPPTAFSQNGTPPNAPSTQATNPFAGSVAAKPVPGVLSISLQDAIDRGLKQNLGPLLSSADIQSARGQRWEQLSALLPHVTADPFIDVSKTNLAEVGLSLKVPGFAFPKSLGPFSYFDARASVTQSLFDW